MTTPGAYTDQELCIRLPDVTAHCLLRVPQRLSRRPCLLLYLAMDRQTNLNVQPYRIAADEFLAAGHCAASFDLPNHGELVNKYGESLVGIAAAMADGMDVFGLVGRLASAAIDACLAAAPGPPRRVFVAGTSRGGLSALHAAAADPRIRAAAAFAPVTDLASLTEFASVAALPITRRSCAAALVERLADRPVFITIAANDPRVGTHHCRDFCNRLKAAGGDVELVVVPGEEHSLPDEAYRQGAVFLLKHAN